MNNYNKFDNPKELDKFLETYNHLLRLNHEETGNMNMPVTNKETDSVIKIMPKGKLRVNLGKGFFIYPYSTLRMLMGK